MPVWSPKSGKEALIRNNMTTLRRMLLTASLAAAACGVASASSIDFLSTPVTVGPSNTDFTYSLSLAKFDPGIDGIPLGATLTGEKIYFFGEENVSTLSLNNASSTVETFTLIASSNITSLSTNSANNADKFSGETLSLFSTGSITLGSDVTPACPAYTPSSSCNVVSYTPPNIVVSNIDPPIGPTGTGGLGVDGIVKSITGADLANYVGAGNFTLGGSTKSLTTFSGGGNNIQTNVNTTAEFSAEVDYTYSVPSGTPEPATMALVGGGLLGLGFLGKFRRKRNNG
jgi:hypothetical protein